MAARREHVLPEVNNPKAGRDYFIGPTFEAGIVLRGTEVKSVRSGHVNIRGAYARIKNGEVWLDGAHIAEYEQGTYMNHDPLRPRKLLLHHREIVRLIARVQAKGQTLVPLKLYITARGKAKLELGLGKGKQLHDRRREIQERDAKRDIERELADAGRP